MKKDSKIIYFEVEPSHKNFDALFKATKELDYDADYPLELELEVVFNYHYDKGRTYGEPENCYPPEFDFEIVNTNCNGIDVVDFLTDKELKKIEDEVICEIY